MSKFVETVVAIVLIVVGTIYSEPWMVKLGIALLVDEAATSLIGSPSAPTGANRPGSRIIQNNTLAPAICIYGAMGHVGGPPSYWNVSGTNNEFLWYVIPISMRPIDQYLLLHIDSDTINLSTDIDGSGNVNTGKYNGFVQIITHIGAIPNTADATLVATFPTEYTTDFKGSSVAYYIVKMMRDTRTDDQISAAVAPQNVRLFQNGPPGELSVSVNGHRVYDPRLDSTNGGSGSMRMNTPTTWAWSANPALIVRDYLTATGIYKTFYSNTGLNVGALEWPTSIIDDVACAASANICDTTFTDTDAVTHAQYSLNGLIDCGNLNGDNIQLMLTTMGGSLIPAGNKFQINAAQYIAPSFAIDETWIADKLTIRNTQPVTPGDAYNYVRGSFIDGSQSYQGADFVPFFNATYELNDGGRLPKDIDLSLITNRYVAQRVAILYGKMSRNQLIVTGNFNLKALNIAVGDTVTLTIKGIFNAKVFKVYNWRLSADGVELQLREESATPYSISTGELTAVPVAVVPGQVYPRPPAPTLVDVQGVGDGINILVIPPPDALYKFMIVYRGTTNVRGSATYRGRFDGGVFHDHELNGGTFWYWIYAVNQANQLSTVLTFGPITARFGVDFTGSGANLMQKVYSIFGVNALAPNVFTTGITSLGSSGSFSDYGFNDLKINFPGSGTAAISFRQSTSEFNLSLQKRKYIFQLVINNETSNNSVFDIQVGFYNSANPAILIQNATALVPDNTHAANTNGRYYCSLDLTGAATLNGMIKLTWNTIPTAGAGSIQGMMLEHQVGNNPYPSPYVIPSEPVTDISGATGGIYGSVPPLTPDMTFSYTATTTSVTWSWGSFSLRRPDGTNTSISSGSQGCTALTAGNPHYFYPFVDEAAFTNAVAWVTGLTGQGGTPNIASAASRGNCVQSQCKIGRAPLSAGGMLANTPSSGTGGGGGGGTSCLHMATRVYCRRKGMELHLRAYELRMGDELLTPTGWAPIDYLTQGSGLEWFGISFNGQPQNECWVTPTEPFYHPDMTFVRANEMLMDEVIQGHETILLVSQIRKFKEACNKIRIGIAAPHVFYLTKNGPLIHNTTQKP